MNENYYDNSEKEILNKIIKNCDNLLQSPYLECDKYIYRIANLILYKSTVLDQVISRNRSNDPHRYDTYLFLDNSSDDLQPSYKNNPFSNPEDIFVFTTLLFLKLTTGACNNSSNSSMSVSEYMMVTFPETTLTESFAQFNKFITIPFKKVLLAMTNYIDSPSSILEYFFQDNAKTIQVEDYSPMPEINLDIIQAKAVNEVLDKIISLSSDISNDKKIKKKDKPIIFSTINDIKYIYSCCKDIKCLCYSFTTLKFLLKKYKKYNQILSVIENCLNEYIDNYFPDDSLLISQIENSKFSI